jgi:hypothetical protein
MVPGLEALMAIESVQIRVSAPVRERLDMIKSAREGDLGREVTYSEVMELLLADWSAAEYMRGIEP